MQNRSAELALKVAPAIRLVRADLRESAIGGRPGFRWE
jgi:hypothetical protein